MGFIKAVKVWFNGDFVDFDDANVHVLSHVIHYGSSVFEGIRAYDNNNGTGIFRLDDHVRRLLDSANIYRMKPSYSAEDLSAAIIDTVNMNSLKSCYVRPIVFRGFSELGVNPLNCPIDVVIATWEWGAYLGKDALENGVRVGVSSWRRPAPNTFPNLAKSGANYMNSQLAKMEAIENGYEEAILLDYQGFIAEGSGENLFVIQNDIIYTPQSSSSILKGITRDSVMTIAKDNGFEIREELIPREMLYTCDEAFFTGTAAELTPINSVDGILIGEGSRGLVTQELQENLFKILEADVEDVYNWMTYI